MQVADANPRGREDAEGEHGIDDEAREGERREPQHGREAGQPDNEGEGDAPEPGLDDTLQLIEARVLPERGVQAKELRGTDSERGECHSVYSSALPEPGIEGHALHPEHRREGDRAEEANQIQEQDISIAHSEHSKKDHTGLLQHRPVLPLNVGRFTHANGAIALT